VQGSAFAGLLHTCKVGEFGGTFATKNGGDVGLTDENGASYRTVCANPPTAAKSRNRIQSFFMGSIAGITPSVIGRSGQSRRDVVEIYGYAAGIGIDEITGTSSGK
jgi:hypothetical protein